MKLKKCRTIFYSSIVIFSSDCWYYKLLLGTISKSGHGVAGVQWIKKELFSTKTIPRPIKKSCAFHCLKYSHRRTVRQLLIFLVQFKVQQNFAIKIPGLPRLRHSFIDRQFNLASGFDLLMRLKYSDTSANEDNSFLNHIR